MGKETPHFCSSFTPLPIFGTYACQQPKDELIFKKLDSSDRIKITQTGHLLFQAASDKDLFWTYVLTINELNLSRWQITFDYFGTDVMIQRFDGRIKIGEVYQSDLVTNFVTAHR
jgi:hypothetical protein